MHILFNICYNYITFKSVIKELVFLCYMMSKGNDLHNLWKSFLFWNFRFGDATDVDVTDC